MKRQIIYASSYFAVTLSLVIAADHVTGEWHDAMYMIAGLFLGLFIPHWVIIAQSLDKKDLQHETTKTT